MQASNLESALAEVARFKKLWEQECAIRQEFLADPEIQAVFLRRFKKERERRERRYAVKSIWRTAKEFVGGQN